MSYNRQNIVIVKTVKFDLGNDCFRVTDVTNIQATASDIQYNFLIINR